MNGFDAGEAESIQAILAALDERNEITIIYPINPTTGFQVARYIVNLADGRAIANLDDLLFNLRRIFCENPRLFL